MNETLGLLSQIESSMGKEVKAKIETISYTASIFILNIVSAHKVTEKDLQIGFASYHARYPERTYEQFLKFKSNSDADKYVFDIEPQGYFIDENTAIKYAESNIGDINEAGSFPYVIISSMPLNRVYPCCNTRSHRIFKFNQSIKQYEQIDWNDEECTKYLYKHTKTSCFL
jgi:hypothetical protein